MAGEGDWIIFYSKSHSMPTEISGGYKCCQWYKRRENFLSTNGEINRIQL